MGQGQIPPENLRTRFAFEHLPSHAWVTNGFRSLSLQKARTRANRAAGLRLQVTNNHRELR